MLLKKDSDAEVTAVFLMADAVVAARKDQKTVEGYYNLERMLKRVVVGKGGRRAPLRKLYGRARHDRQ